MRRKSHKRSLKWLNTVDHCYFGFGGNVRLMEQSINKGVKVAGFPFSPYTPPLSLFHGFASIFLLFGFSPGGGGGGGGGGGVISVKNIYTIGIQSVGCYLKMVVQLFFCIHKVFFFWVEEKCIFRNDMFYVHLMNCLSLITIFSLMCMMLLNFWALFL